MAVGRSNFVIQVHVAVPLFFHSSGYLGFDDWRSENVANLELAKLGIQQT